MKEIKMENTHCFLSEMQYVNEIESIIQELDKMLQTTLFNEEKISATIYRLFYEMVNEENDEKRFHDAVIDFMLELYELVYLKASYQEELLLHDMINDEDGHFFESYRNYTPSINQDIVCELNELCKKSQDIQYTRSNLHLVEEYISKIVFLWKCF